MNDSQLSDDSSERLPTLLVLTDPLPIGRWLYSETLRATARFVRDRVQKPQVRWNSSRYRGHFAVTRSVIEGLGKASLPYRYNSIDLRDEPAPTLVLCGRRTLEQAIILKREGVIGRLFAGPNIVTFPSDHAGLLTAPEVDGVIVPSQWVADSYESDTPELVGKCAVWGAGVDTDYWKPDACVPREKVLIFIKNRELQMSEYVARMVEPLDHHILYYGDFNHDVYRGLLSRSRLMIGFSASESQGIAWQEAWSMDVPTLIYDSRKITYRNRTLAVSSAPYLTEYTGSFFSNCSEFERGWSHWMSPSQRPSPRKWMTDNLNDVLAARNIYKIATGTDFL